MKPNERAGEVGRRHVTVLESVEEIRALVRQGDTVHEGMPPTVEVPESAVARAAEPYRPVDRPPMAVLTVLDDGHDTGEQVRLRSETFVIGRVGGDLIIPHDGGLSGRHAQIVRRAQGDEFHWYLVDLQSTNGTFARVAHVSLRHGQEFLVGRTRLRFETGVATPRAVPPTVASPFKATPSRKAPAARDPEPGPPTSLVELTSHGEGRRFPLTGPESRIGRDPKPCRINLDDPTVNPQHARLFLDARGRWVLENLQSVNGTWARVEEVCLGRGGQFLCGEQRFLVKIL